MDSSGQLLAVGSSRVDPWWGNPGGPFMVFRADLYSDQNLRSNNLVNLSFAILVFPLEE
jgi:hypothetical protein